MARAAPGAAAIPAGAVARAEEAAGEVVRRVRPTEASERRRAAVVGYARRLVGTALGCEVSARAVRGGARPSAPVSTPISGF